MSELAAAREYVWEALASKPIRRAMIGRQRCDAITRVALVAMPDDAELIAAGPGTSLEKILVERTERRVRANYNDRSGFAFTTMLVLWAISLIVQILVARWWKRRNEGAGT